MERTQNGLNKTQPPVQTSFRRYRTQEVAGSSPASSIANVPAIRDLLCDATSRQVVSCYRRATKPIFEDPFIRNRRGPQFESGRRLRSRTDPAAQKRLEQMKGVRAPPDSGHTRSSATPPLAKPAIMAPRPVHLQSGHVNAPSRSYF